MEVKLQSVLEEGEQLLWSGRPEPIGTLQGLYKSAILRKILMIVAGIVILAGWYISAAVKNGVDVQPIAIIVCALPFLYSIYNDFADAKALRERTLYAMTDRRMITVVDKAVSGVEYDMIVSAGAHIKGEYNTTPLLKEKMMLACLKGAYPGEKFRLSDFRGERFITMSDSFQLYEQTMLMCREEGFAPNIVIQADDPYYVRRYVEMGLGVAIVPSISWRGQFSDNIQLIDIGDHERKTVLYTPRLRTLNPAVMRLSEIIFEVFSKESENALA